MEKLLTILFFFLYTNLSATTYYVSNGGNDANSGLSSAAPFRTLAKVNTLLLNPGDRVLFNRDDVFYGNLVITRSGSAGLPIIYSSYGTGADPVITGFTTVSAWTSLGGNIWESTSAISTLSTANMVVIAGVNYPMGRFPQTGYLTYTAHSTYVSIFSSSLNSAATNWTGAELVIRKNNYVTDRCLITGHSGSTLNYSSTDTYNGTDGYGFYIQNDQRTLTYTNAWYYSPTTKKIRIYRSAPLNIQVSTVDTLVTMIGSLHHVTFDSLKFTGANKFAYTIRSCQNVTIQNCTFDFNHNVIWGGQNGGAPGSTGFVFQNNTLDHTNNEALVLESEFSGAQINHNVINNTGTVDGMGGNGSGNYGTLQGIVLAAANSIFEYNTIHKVGHNGISYSRNGVIIRYNFIDSFCMQKFDAGGIYSYVGKANSTTKNPLFTGQKVYNNIVLNGVYPVAGTSNTGNTLVNCFYADGVSSNIEFYNNTGAFAPQAGILVNNADSNINVHDNTFFGNGQYQAFIVSNDLNFPIRSLSFKNNISVSKYATELVTSWNSLINDISTYGICDSNYWARPIDDNLTFETYIPPNNVKRTLAMWRTYSGYDIHSNKSPVTITNVSQLDFRYNATESPVVETLLPGSWVDVRNTAYSGTVTLQPYTSIVLISTGAGNTLPSASAGTDQSITWPTNSVSLSGSGTDADGTISAYQWTKVSGGTATITSPTSASTTVSNLAVGTYVFALQVTDNSGGTNTDQMQVTVSKGTATISVTGTTKTFNNTPQGVTVTTSPAGLSTSTTYNGVTTQPTNAGSYTFITSGTDPNYNFNTVTGTFTITKATAVINASDQTVNYDGNPQSITATTTPSVLGLTYTYNGSSTPPTAIGTYTVHITLVNANYQATAVDVTLSIVSNPAIIFISDTTFVYDGLSHGVTVTSLYSYSLTGSPHTQAGSYTVIATINDGIHTGADTATLTITKKPAVLSWIQPAPIPYGSLLTTSIENATADISGTWTYDYPLGTQLPIGSTVVTGTFTPTDSTNKVGGSISRTISVFGVNPFLDYFIRNGQIFFIEQ